MATQNIKISGCVVSFETKKGISNLRVEAWGCDVLVNDFVGEAVTGFSGEFTITFTNKHYQKLFLNANPDIYFKIYEGEKFLYSSINDVLWNLKGNKHDIQLIIPMKNTENRNKEEIIREFKDRGLLNTPKEKFKVSGKVIYQNGNPGKRMKLIAVDVDLKGAAVYKKITKEKELHKNSGFENLSVTSTDREGNYSFLFVTEQFRRAERKKADVVVFAVEDGTIIGRSRMVNSEDYSDCGEVRNLDVIIVSSAKRTEYQTVMIALNKFLDESGVTLAELSRSSDQILFTASELDFNQKVIKIAADAAALIVELKIKQHELLYGIGRQNISLSLSALFQKKERELLGAIEKSVRSGIIQKPSEKDVSNLLNIIHKISVSSVLTEKSKTYNYSLGDILSFALPSDELRAIYAESIRNFTGEPAKFWTDHLPSLPAFKNKPELIDSLQLTMQLSAITGNHMPLVEVLQTKQKISSAKALVNLSTGEWKEILNKSGIPEGIPGSSPDEKTNNYIFNIRNILNAAFPTVKIAGMIKNQEFPISEPDIYKNMLAFLDSGTSFDFATSKVSDFEKELREFSGNHFDTLNKEMKKIQRVFAVSADPEAMKVLMDAGLHSANSIASIPQKTFIRKYGDAMGGHKKAAIVHQRSKYISMRTEKTVAGIADFMNGVVPQTVVSKFDFDELFEVLANQIPNYSELFGSPDICECEHCRSVYSPAAYFVDLLRFLWRGEENNNGKSPLDMLTTRRPDLLFLPLTCENTNTVIPYIDLVNEVMEYYTANGTLDKNAAYDTGETTADELRANPQNFNLEAYRKVKDKVYPFTLPYHQPLDVIRTYSHHLKSDRIEVMEAMQTDFSTTVTHALDAEALRLSQEEYLVLTLKKFDDTADSRSLHEYYGYTAHGDLENLAEVREFLLRSGVKYADLVELVKTQFINPGQWTVDFLEDLFYESNLEASEIYTKLGQIKNGTLNPATDTGIMDALNGAGIQPTDFKIWAEDNLDAFKNVITLFEPNSQCDLDTTVLRTVKNVYENIYYSGIEDASWSAMHRFIRLWRKLGWTIHETDLILNALGQADISEETIHYLSYINRINTDLKKSLNYLAVFWGSIDSYGKKSLYEKLFLNRAVQRIDMAFEADEWGNYLDDETELLGDHIPALLAAFRITEEELNAILKVAKIRDGVVDRELDPTIDILNIQNISTLYRYVVLSKTLKTKITDFCSYITLFGATPFSIWNTCSKKYDDIDPKVTYEFCELISEVKKSGFKAATLEYILSGTLPADSNIGLKENKILKSVVTIRESFAKIEQDHPDSPESPYTPAMLVGKLLLTYQTDVVTELLAIIDGTQKFELMTEANLAIILPESLSSKYNYTKGSGRFACIGVMTDNEKTSLKALSVNANFQSAVDSLYALPEKFIEENFSGILTGLTDAKKILLDHPKQVTGSTYEEKLQYIYDCYLPLLKKKLRNDSIVQHIATLTDLSNESAAIIAKNDLDSIVVSIANEGFSAEYFKDNVFGVSAFTRTDASINFTWVGSPDASIPSGDNFSIRWQSGIVPPSSGEYTIVVGVSQDKEEWDLYLDEVLILSRATGDNLSMEVVVDLNASTMHKLKLEYSNTAIGSGITLSWKTATTSPEVISASSAYPEQTLQDFIEMINLYHRASKFITGFKLSDAEVSHFKDNSANFASLDFKALTSVHWQRIRDYVELGSIMPQSITSLIDIFEAANVAHPTPLIGDTSTEGTLSKMLCDASGWDSVSLNYLINTHFALSVNDFKNEISLARLAAVMQVVRKTGVSAETLSIWAEPEADFDKLDETANLIKSTVKAKYEEEDWLKLAGKLSDTIRENQKNALIAYLLTKQELQNWGVEDADGLFEYFLIDVQMGACMDTSRIVQANASVQMFINRCLLNLESDKSSGVEKGVSPTSIDTDRYEWMKNYRVWEANRKVFLYPENWLEPEWRNDRSCFFKDLESELVQNDITDISVENAFRNYLSKLNEVANLEVCGSYEEKDDDGNLVFLHVFARSNNAPYKYYYRTWSQYMKWNAWESVTADIRGTESGENSGVHLIPIVWKKRLFLFWPEFLKGQKPASTGSTTISDMAYNEPASTLKADEYWEVRLAWTEYTEGKWTPKQISKEFLEAGNTDLYNYSFSTAVGSTTNQLCISLLNDIDELEGTFKLADIQSKVQIDSLSVHGEDPLVEYRSYYTKRKKTGELAFLNNTYLKASKEHKILFTNEARDFESTLNYPFFYHDNTRTYFVRPDTLWITYYVKAPEYYLPSFPELLDDNYYEIAPPRPGIDPDDYFPYHGPGDPDNPEYFNSEDFYTDPSSVTTPGYISNFRPVNRNSSGNDTEMRMMTLKMIAGNPGETTANNVNRFIPDNLESHYTIKDSGAFGGVGYVGMHVGMNKVCKKTKGLEFHTFYHPNSSQFVTNLNQGGIEGLLDSDDRPVSETGICNDNGVVFETNYIPNFTNSLVKKATGDRTFYKENVCFDVYGANSIYNWELFFHAPLYIATRLSKNGRYEEALKWFHYIFNPSSDELPAIGESETSRFWKVLPFKTTPAESLSEWFMNLNANLNPEMENAIIGEWRDNPFDPHLVASNRPLAYMKNVVIKYVDNLINWGDSLFRRDTMESVNEALQIYVIANHILGPRPEFVPSRGEVKAETYDSLKDKLDDFSNALVELENIFPYSSDVSISDEDPGVNLLGVGDALYFCIPANEKLLEYWDRVTDRLYKIRHCLNIDGVKRRLALFDPPIDPAALVQAASQGLSLGSILADLSSPPPIYRFNYLIQKANEFCSEVTLLGSALLSVLENKDASELERLKATQETAMLELVTAVKERQVLEANSSKAQLEKVRETAIFRLNHYTDLLNYTDITVPSVPALSANLTSDSSLPADTNISLITSDVDTSVVDSDEAGVKLIKKEKEEIDKNYDAHVSQMAAGVLEAIAGVAHIIPTVSADGKPFGIGVGASWGGTQLGNAFSAGAKIAEIFATQYSYESSQAAKMASYIRREQDWTLQANLAANEIIQIDKQITSADIRIQIAEKELSNHLQHIEDSKTIEQFLKDKFTNKELYQWMKEQLFAVYKQSYNMAYDMAKKAEKCYRYELGTETASFIQYGYWDNSHQGLLSGERLQGALKQMEKSYIEENKRELEIRKAVSMAIWNPLALQELRSTGVCYFKVTEEMLDLDFQGHYFRRLRSVSLTIPCIAGPYASVNCTLRLIKNHIRTNTTTNSEGLYEHNHDEGVWIDDDRFRSSNVPVTSIATSSAQNDSGMFELNFRDERYLPFEGAGAISEWMIELASDEDLRQFDYSTISDVVLHLNYTAREDSGLFRDSAIEYLTERFLMNPDELESEPLMQGLSLKHQFPNQWYKFLHPSVAGDDQVFELTLQRMHFPFFTRKRGITVKKIEIMLNADRSGDYHVMMSATNLDTSEMTTANAVLMPENETYGMQKVTFEGTVETVVIEEIDIFSEMTLRLKHNTDTDYHSMNTDPDELSDIMMVVHYHLGDA